MLKKEAVSFPASCHLFEKGLFLLICYFPTHLALRKKDMTLTFVILDIQYGVSCVRINIMRAIRFSFLCL